MRSPIGKHRPSLQTSTILSKRLALQTHLLPDGGYGWVIVAACGVLAFWFIGTTYSWGVLQDALVQKHLGSASSLSFVGSLATACVAAFAIINGRLIRAVGATKDGVPRHHPHVWWSDSEWICSAQYRSTLRDGWLDNGLWRQRLLHGRVISPCTVLQQASRIGERTRVCWRRVSEVL